MTKQDVLKHARLDGATRYSEDSGGTITAYRPAASLRGITWQGFPQYAMCVYAKDGNSYTTNFLWVFADLPGDAEMV